MPDYSWSDLHVQLLTECLLNLFYVLECLITCDLNKILSIKKCFIYVLKDANVRKDFEELNFEAKTAPI